MQLPVRGHPLHTRALTLVVESLSDGRWHARGDVVDLRKVGFVPMLSDIQPAGIIHQMSIELVVDPATTQIDSVEVDQRAVAIEPSESTRGECCRDPAERLHALAGERLDGAFARRLSGVFGGPRGCSHLLTLFQLMASGLQRAFVLESELGAGASAREVGDRLFRRAAFVEGFEAEDQSIEMAIQLADFHSQPLAPGAAPTQRLAGQWDARVFARATGAQRTLSDLLLADRMRTGDTLATASWRDQSGRLATLEGSPIIPGLARRLFEVFDAAEDRLLLDACLQLAPGFIQVMAAVMDRWLSGGVPEAPGTVPGPSAAMAEAGSIGGLPDSCYMWRAGGPMASMRTVRQLEGADE
ncbi:MAG: DUF2889 domain-containing protein [Myxococcota bacterium]|nr:DUF2889 domain-containing protein [Myxococcota bacterium]